MEKTIYNLVKNTISQDVGEYFIKALIEEMPNEEIIELALKELKSIKYFVRIELDEWSYWKQKEQRLFNLIIELKKTTNE
tara:strand:- start:3302 stop:3541 length:240 start_codon:yes stop_codon:yes gene_type:complete